MWPQLWLADPLFWTYGFLNWCLYFPFRPQKPFRVKKPRNFPFVMLWPIFVVPLRLNTLHNIRIYQNLLPLVGSAMCHFFFMELQWQSVQVYFFFFFDKTALSVLYTDIWWWFVFLYFSKCCDQMLMTPRAIISWTIEALLFCFTVFISAATKGITHLCAFFKVHFISILLFIFLLWVK